MLNAYLDGVCAAILSLEGTVDKFIGDAVFAIFNAPADQPDHAERASAVRAGDRQASPRRSAPSSARTASRWA